MSRTGAMNAGVTAVRTGFCSRRNDAASHARCKGALGVRPCVCECHTAVDLTPGSPEWCRRVSPSKAAAILGISPWDSPRSMWHKMRGDIPWDEESEAMERGTLCEPAVLAWWRKHHEHGSWAEQVSYTLDDWCVATPDAVTEHEGDVIGVEAKTAATLDDWGDPGTDEIPVYYLAQVYVAMGVMRRAGTPVQRVHVPVLGGRRLLFSNYVVEYDEAICDDLLERMQRFAVSLDCDVAPDLDDTVATYDAVRKVHPDIEPKAEVVLTEAEAVELVEAIAEQDGAEARARAAKSLVIARMAKAQYAVCNGERIARRQPNKTGVSFVPVAKTTHFVSKESAA